MVERVVGIDAFVYDRMLLNRRDGDNRLFEDIDANDEGVVSNSGRARGGHVAIRAASAPNQTIHVVASACVIANATFEVDWTEVPSRRFVKASQLFSPPKRKKVLLVGVHDTKPPLHANNFCHFLGRRMKKNQQPTSRLKTNESGPENTVSSSPWCRMAIIVSCPFIVISVLV
jgi:hypothetical protein